MIPVQFHSEAEAELGEAVSFYELRLAGLGSSFAAEIQNSIRFIRAFPEGGSPVGGKLRKVVVKRFPYSVIYRSEAETIYIVAVAHNRRRPAYWKGR